mmetsp:Transcript_7711/g.21480  ORF Transcript_7711/g.21480 Transcript_7711/m.21480 type:complete len:190 (+) Transcript_7711:67-636(+)|eukprot:CAMPEP_0168754444 /NCGR_PEP_ID=MMETSP0724-20121128/19507_1 /TAXON_ID=265536 /ORGANISM="Amphiprora sp., Strain CCMP467" /LENGTH=189 /DNA_ID=CAMNT_0008802929 /DNA_START=25 /DNA_END=594 /DNA_ORIENTATION=-
MSTPCFVLACVLLSFQCPLALAYSSKAGKKATNDGKKKCVNEFHGSYYYQSPRSGRIWQVAITCFENGDYCRYSEATPNQGCSQAGFIPQKNIDHESKEDRCSFGFTDNANVSDLVSISPAYSSSERAVAAGCPEHPDPYFVRGYSMLGQNDVWRFQFCEESTAQDCLLEENWFVDDDSLGYFAHKIAM